jgi:hypothetical protein
MGFKTFENDIFLEILYINFDIIVFLKIQNFEIFLKIFCENIPRNIPQKQDPKQAVVACVIPCIGTQFSFSY